MPVFGVRAHDFGTLPVEALARRVAASGAACVQLALSKALAGSPSVPDALGPGGAAAVRDAFGRRDVGIAVLGCYIDLVAPDPRGREDSLLRFEAHLRAAVSFDCRIVGTETGSPLAYSGGRGGEAAAFREAVASVRRLARVAETTGKGGAVVGIEAVADGHTVSSARLMKRLLEEVGSSAVGVIFDASNLVPVRGVPSMEEFLDGCFEAFGERIVAVHAKDYRMVPGPAGPRKSEALPAGCGEMDWPGLFARLRGAGRGDVPILLENAGPSEAPAAIARMRAAWEGSRTA